MRNANAPNHFVFVATPVQSDKGRISSYEIWKVLTEKLVWYTTASAPYRNRIKGGDRIVFYLGGRPGGGSFVAQGLCSGPVAPVTAEDGAFLAEMGITRFSSRIPLLLVIYWLDEVPLKPLVPALTFIRDKKHYGLYLRQGIVPIGQEDFDLIVTQSAQ
ncbi:EVE domain-containing protein [Candidatus Desulforudis audaxviator]|uniref:Uncharacterized protein n=1 Tax=Desulforudis audaxviator (strain MP104C) TaxID=477974 RepID=B1I4V0_DESAP|nr:EVE domain-containing protein [Candidatus Desulforudis audaxviator]ACA60018.1 protein of unknown function DUF55 [Candidatus Desulforudis audaxviator MP104C]AZK60037.1 hypothetical protein Daudx_1490 [Candidatus Desulforudis audaxviator]